MSAKKVWLWQRIRKLISSKSDRIYLNLDCVFLYIQKALYYTHYFNFEIDNHASYTFVPRKKKL